MKTGTDALGTARNEFGRAKHENKTRRPDTAESKSGRAKHENENQRPRYRRERVRMRKRAKTGPDAHGTAEKVSGTAKVENET
jgi:hypothetical protein